MDNIQKNLIYLQRHGMTWENVYDVVKIMKDTVTLHDGRVLSKLDLCLLLCPASVYAMEFITILLNKAETCVINNVVYTASSLFVWLINTNQIRFDSEACRRLVKIIDKHHSQLFLAVIKNKIYSVKDIILHGLEESQHDNYYIDTAVPFLMMRLAMLMHESETVTFQGKFHFTRLSLLLHVLNYRVIDGCDTVVEQATQLILQYLPSGSRLVETDEKEYVILPN